MSIADVRFSTPAHRQVRAADGTWFVTGRGRALLCRTLRTADTGLLAEMLTRLSARTIYLRYMMPLPSFTPDRAWREATRLTHADRRSSAALLVVAGCPGSEQAVAVAEVAIDAAEPRSAEAALLVADAYQGQGIGRLLARQLPGLATGLGADCIIATAAPDNYAVRRLAAASRLPYEASLSYGALNLRFDLRASPVDTPAA